VKELDGLRLETIRQHTVIVEAAQAATNINRSWDAMTVGKTTATHNEGEK
jgi:hypothetical protein